MSVRPEAFGFFDGSEGSYYTWRSKFVRMVHVQKVHVIHKACALDQSVSAKIRENLFEGLETTHLDYLLRIRRLEDHYGDDDGQLDIMPATYPRVEGRTPRRPKEGPIGCVRS